MALRRQCSKLVERLERASAFRAMNVHAPAPPTFPTALVDRRAQRELHHRGSDRPAALLPLLRGAAAAANVDEATVARRGVPVGGELRQVAKGAAPNPETFRGHHIQSAMTRRAANLREDR